MPPLIRPVVPPGSLAKRPQPVIEGEGLALRPWDANDIPVLTAAYSNPDIQQWHGRSLTAAEAEEWIAERARAWAGETGADWGVTAASEMVGRVMLKGIALAEGLAEIGYWVLPHARDAGVASRAARVLSGWCFEDGWHDMHLHARLASDRPGRLIENPNSGGTKMQIRTRMSISADGYVTTPDGWPSQLADPAFVSGQSHGFPEFVAECEAALMGRTTFEPALASDRWPWPDLNVFVLGSHRPEGTPDHVVVDSDPARLLERVRESNQGRDVHLVGGPTTIETFRALGALDKIQLIVLPLLLGDGMRLTPALSPDTGLIFESQQALPGGSVEIVYACDA